MRSLRSSMACDNASLPLSCTFSPSTSMFLYVMPMLLYIWLPYAHLWPYFLHLQLPNTSLNGGNVCLATLHSSDRDLQPFYYVYMNTYVRLSLLPSSTSTYIFCEHFQCSEWTPMPPLFQQTFFQDCILSPFYYLRLTTEHFANIFVTTLTEQSL
jgi:hypothetical protein